MIQCQTKEISLFFMAQRGFPAFNQRTNTTHSVSNRVQIKHKIKKNKTTLTPYFFKFPHVSSSHFVLKFAHSLRADTKYRSHFWSSSISESPTTITGVYLAGCTCFVLHFMHSTTTKATFITIIAIIIKSSIDRDTV